MAGEAMQQRNQERAYLDEEVTLFVVAILGRRDR